MRFVIMKIVKQQKLHMKKGQAGVSMLEILIALLITCVGLLGFAGLQSRALVATEDTYQRTQATSIAQEVIDRMRMSNMVPGALSNPYLLAAPEYTAAGSWSGAVPAALDSCLGIGKKCSASDMAKYDIAQIRNVVETSSNLPNGSVLVTQCENNRICAYVAWGSVTAAQCSAAKAIGVKSCVVIQGA